jgi:hypothetical protein
MQEHVQSLRSKHQHLERQIDDEMHRPMPDQSTLSRLKKEKLLIKEQLERIVLSGSHLSLTSQALN